MKITVFQNLKKLSEKSANSLMSSLGEDSPVSIFGSLQYTALCKV